MRIFRRKQFLSLPAGTIYAKGKRWYFSDFSVKADTLDNDWVQLSPMWIESRDDDDQFTKLEAMLEVGASYPMAESYGRDGFFDDDDLFLVPDRADLEQLRGIIDAALAVAKT